MHAAQDSNDIWRWLIPAILVFSGAILGQVLASWNQSRLMRRDWEARRRDRDMRKVQDAFDYCVEISDRLRPFMRAGDPPPDDVEAQRLRRQGRMDALLARVGDKPLEQRWEVWEQADVAFTLAAEDDRDAWRARYNAMSAFHRRVEELSGTKPSR